MSRSVPGSAPPDLIGLALAGTCAIQGTAGRGMETTTALHGRFQPSAKGRCHTRRQVVARPVLPGIVTRAASNRMLRQPALLRQFAGPSLRRAVTIRSPSESPIVASGERGRLAQRSAN